MVFWLAVLVGGLFAWIAVQIGFYATWIMFFHLVLSAYVAVFLAPVVVAHVPAATETPFGYALTFASIAVATLLIGYGTCFACLSGRLKIEFPKVMDTTAAGVLGFLNGFLILSFVGFAFALTPLSQLTICKSLGFDAKSQTTNTAYMCWWCNQFHSLVSYWGNERTSQQAIHDLLEKTFPPPAKPANAEATTSKPTTQAVPPPTVSPHSPAAPPHATPSAPEVSPSSQGKKGESAHPGPPPAKPLDSEPPPVKNEPEGKKRSAPANETNSSPAPSPTPKDPFAEP